jgi:hypothetical protein
LEFVRTRRYLKDLKRIGASAGDQIALEAAIAAAPQSGDLIIGLKGLRKIRFKIGNKSKSGGARAIYMVAAFGVDGRVLMLTAYAKNEQADLSPDQRKALLKLMKEIEHG